jgi:hypothetical protein
MSRAIVGRIPIAQYSRSAIRPATSACSYRGSSKAKKVRIACSHLSILIAVFHTCPEINLTWDAFLLSSQFTLYGTCATQPLGVSSTT